MQQFAQYRPAMPEAGGILLGRHLLDSSAIIVDAITTPMPGDRQARTHFYRDHPQHQKVIDAAWHESKGTCTYLGEWHTHPEANPKPSSVDYRDWRRRLHQDMYTEPLFFIIVGTACTLVWEGGKLGTIVQLSACGSNPPLHPS